MRGGREIGRADVQELRKDLAHYSAQMGLVLAPGEAGRDARGEASAAAQAPVALYVGEALPEEMIACRVGVTVESVEVPDLDEAFFAGLSRQREERAGRRDREDRIHEEPAAAASEAREVAVEASPAAEPASTVEAQTAPEVPPPEPVVPAAEGGEEPREARRRRGREDRPRATNAAEQAWGQPAGTMRFAPPPGPTVVSSTTPLREEASAEVRPEERAGDERREEPSADERHEGEAEQTPAPDAPKSEPF